MRGISVRIGFALIVPSMIFAACADSSNEPGEPGLEAGAPDSPREDAGETADAGDARVDAEVLRCSLDFCLLDLPNPGTYGFTKWVFAGVQADPVIGVWAIANGIEGKDRTTAQILHFENDTWKPVHAPALGDGADRRPIHLVGLASDGAGKLLAVGFTVDDRQGVVVRGDGTTFTTTAFPVEPTAVWSADPNNAWITGTGGTVFHSLPNGSWEADTTATEGTFFSVWGTGPKDVYFGGINDGEFSFEMAPFLGHRTVDGAGVTTWTYREFPDFKRYFDRFHRIVAGVAPREGTPVWISDDAIARFTAADGGGMDWVLDPFDPPVVIRSLWQRGKDDLWGVGEVGRIYHFDGTTWEAMLLAYNGAPPVNNLMGIAGTSTDMFIVGDGIALRRKTP